MEREEMKMIVSVAAKGDTTRFEQLLEQPGARNFFEITILVLLQQLPSSEEQKADHFKSFLTIIKQVEEKITRRKSGEGILKKVFS